MRHLHSDGPALSPEPYVVVRGTGTPLLFIHGNGVDHRLLLEFDEVFAGSWRRVHIDLPGFGRTPALTGPGGLPELADWLDLAVGHLIGDAAFAIVGNSLGGLLARDLTRRRMPQVLGLALLAPVIDPRPGNRTLPPPTVLYRDEALLGSLPAAGAGTYAEMAVVQTRDNWERFAARVLPGLQAADPDAIDRLARRYALPTSPDVELSVYDRPVLIVTGRQDHVVGFADQHALAAQLPDASFAVLHPGGHNLTVDQPDAVRDLLADWQRRLHPRKPHRSI